MAAPQPGREPSSAPSASGGRRVLAVIPARGGSKGVPAKNLAKVGGLPLVSRAVRACLGAPLVTDVAVSTDDPDIAAAARAAGAEVVERPEDIAGDLATSEAAVLHAMETHEARHGHAVDVVLLVQCTSPFIAPEDLQGVAAAVAENGADSALTVAPFHGFVWRDAEATAAAADGTPGVTTATARAAASARDGAAGQDGAGGPVREGRLAYGAPHVTGAEAYPDRASSTCPQPSAPPAAGGRGVNHDKAFRPRRQDRPQDHLETGAAYGMDAAGFRKAGHRFFGRTDLVHTDPARVLEIDDPHDLARARALAPLLDGDTGAATGEPSPPHRQVTPRRDDIDAVVLDFDGTQTDDRVLIDSEGREFVAVHRGDGLGIGALRRDDALKLLILSTEQNPVVAARARKLRVPVLHGIDRKDLALKQWCEEQGVAPERVLYVGNDVNDLGCFGLVGWPVAVASAHDVVRGAARAVTTAPGGAGAIREIASWLLGPSL